MSLTPLPNGHYPLSNDQVYFLPLVDKDASGNVVPAPAGDTVSASTSGQFAASLAATVTVMPGTSNPAISLTPMVVESGAENGGGAIGLVLTDSAGLAEDTATSGLLFDIVQSVAPPATEGVDITQIVSQSQAVPTSPGP